MACDMGFIGDLRQAQWAAGSLEDHQHFGSSMESPSSSSSSIGFTSASSCTSTSADLADDASSSSSSFSSGPLCELSDLIAQLPIKRGLSKFYDGKSQTFGSLANVRSLEDLAKKETTCYSRRIKSCKSYGGDLYRQKFGPTPRIKKR